MFCVCLRIRERACPVSAMIPGAGYSGGKFRARQFAMTWVQNLFSYSTFSSFRVFWLNQQCCDSFTAVNSEDSATHIHMYPFSLNSPPSRLPYNIGWRQFHVLYCGSLLVIHCKYSSVYVHPKLHPTPSQPSSPATISSSSKSGQILFCKFICILSFRSHI